MKRDLPAWFDSELDWYANEHDGAMGLRGQPLEPSMGGGDDSMADDRRIEAATRGKRIERALQGLRTGWRTLLMASHLRISPRRHQDIHKAHEAMLRECKTELMEAAAAFRRGMLRGKR